MSDGFAYADIIILALIAGFVLLRLRSVLGQKIGHDSPPFPGYRKQDADSPVVQVTEKAARAQEEREADALLLSNVGAAPARDGLEAIKQADGQFSLARFLDGAKGAFEMVFDAFAKQDKDTLKMLLSTPLYELFSAELDKRKAGDSYAETTLLALNSAEVAGAELSRSLAKITVRFVSEQVRVVRDRDGKIVEGNPSQSEHVEEEWVFERDITSRNPNWKIIET